MRFSRIRCSSLCVCKVGTERKGDLTIHPHNIALRFSTLYIHPLNRPSHSSLSPSISSQHLLPSSSNISLSPSFNPSTPLLLPFLIPPFDPSPTFPPNPQPSTSVLITLSSPLQSTQLPHLPLPSLSSSASSSSWEARASQTGAHAPL